MPMVPGLFETQPQFLMRQMFQDTNLGRMEAFLNADRPFKPSISLRKTGPTGVPEAVRKRKRYHPWRHRWRRRRRWPTT